MIQTDRSDPGPVIICAAVTGGVPPGRAAVGHPVTPEAVREAALAAAEAGASIVHLHARLPDGDTTSDAGAYRDLVRDLREAGCPAILSLSAGDDGGRANHAARLAVADCGGELVSLSAGSFNTGTRLYDNRPEFGAEMCRRIRAAGAAPEIEVIDTGHVATVARWLEDGLLTPPVYVQFVMGGGGGMPADPALLPILLARLPDNAVWSVCCQGQSAETFEVLQRRALALGGNVRTGQEDHAWLAPGAKASDSASMVRAVSGWAADAGRPVATPARARVLMGLATR